MSFKRFAFPLLTLALVACGGGGGGGGEGGGEGGGGSQSSELSFGALTPGSISMKVADTSVVQHQQFTLNTSYSGSTGSTVYIVVDDPDRLFASAIPSFSAGQASMLLELSSTVAPGRYTQPVVIKACKDAACTRQFAGSPQTVAKDVSIESIQVGATALSFTGAVGAGAVAQDLVVTPPSGKTYDYAPLYVDYRAPNGSTGQLSPTEVFDITYTTTGLQIKPKGAWEGSYRWTLQLNSPGYNSKQVSISYDVAGTSVQPLTLLNTTLSAALTGSNTTYADIDVLLNLPVSELRFTISGTPDPVQSGWLLFYTSEVFTSGSGPAGNAKHLRFKFDSCGYGIGACMGRGSYNANIRIDAVAFGQTWTYNVPVTFTVP